MGIQERREREREERKDSILEAAEQIFFSKGYDTTTMDEIAEKAEYAKGTLYTYFSSKEELYLAIIVKGVKILREYFLNYSEKGRNGLEKVKKIGEGFMAYFEKYPQYFMPKIFYDVKKHEINSESEVLQEYRKISYELNEIMKNNIILGIKDGSIQKHLDPKKLTIMLWASATGLMMLLDSKKELLNSIYEIDKDEMINYYFDYHYKIMSGEICSEKEKKN